VQNGISLIIHYFRGILFSFFSLFIVGWVLVLGFQTPLSSLLVLVISHTPGVGTWNGDTFTMDTDQFIRFVIIWGFVGSLVLFILKKIFHISILFSFKKVVILVTILHLILLLDFLFMHDGSWYETLFSIGFFYILVMAAAMLYYGLGKLEDLISTILHPNIK
jgi:hypothetical protein